MLTGEEKAFYRAIACAPKDDAPKLVFADWLDEHGRDVEAELLRIKVRLTRLVHESEMERRRKRAASKSGWNIKRKVSSEEHILRKRQIELFMVQRDGVLTLANAKWDSLLEEYKRRQTLRARQA